MTYRKLIDVVDVDVPGLAGDPWSGAHKIPWNDPEFSRRMLREHLSQEHDLASRRRERIDAACRFLVSEFPSATSGSVLDLGCGPGLYAPHMARHCRRYLGVDFSPASLEYARTQYAVPGLVEFVLGNVLEADLCWPFELGTSGQPDRSGPERMAGARTFGDGISPLERMIW